MTRLLADGTPIYLPEAGRGADPYRGNYGHHVGDDPEAVRARRDALAASIGRRIVWMNQTHSTRVALIRRDCSVGCDALDLDDSMASIEADGVVIDAREWTDAPAAAVLTADCLPILVSAAGGRIIAAVHAGRRGLLDGIVSRAVDLIRSLDPDCAIHAYIAPAICAKCYEVPEQMRDEAQLVNPATRGTTSWGTPSIDLGAGARAVLDAAGCLSITIDARCTLETPQLHSFRRDSGCGRNASVIAPRA